ncbi:MAG: periplasmic heavy metal sensor [bacterium]
MKKYSNRLAVSIGLAASFLLVSIAFAQPPDCTGEKCNFQGKKKAELIKELNLTEEQQEKMGKLREGQKKEGEELREKLQAKMKELKTELDKPESTKSSIEPIVSEIKALKNSIFDQRMNHLFDVKEILTPEQFKKLNKKHEAGKKDMKKMNKNKKGEKRGKDKKKEQMGE